jgi:sulfatase modifying factor 1
MKATRLAAILLAIFILCRIADAVTIPTVPIGNHGNPADTRFIDSYHPSGVGSVAYSFNIGKTEITNSQYVVLLNAVAASDPYELYNLGMTSDTVGGIVRSGISGGFTYAVKAPALSDTYTYEDKPVVFVNSGDAMRFANWLHNGQPTGGENAATTEDGAYTLNGAINDATLAAVTRNSGARWWLPNEDEWYKTAYHKNDGVTGNYWTYPTGTNDSPNHQLPIFDTGNSMNYSTGSCCYTTGNGSYPLTDAGAYTLSEGPYGTFDQGGNVWDLNETLFVDDIRSRGLRGSAWNKEQLYTRASKWIGTLPTFEDNNIGFRVASMTIPEPNTLLFFVAGFGPMFGCRVARRRTHEDRTMRS